MPLIVADTANREGIVAGGTGPDKDGNVCFNVSLPRLLYDACYFYFVSTLWRLPEARSAECGLQIASLVTRMRYMSVVCLVRVERFTTHTRYASIMQMS